MLTFVNVGLLEILYSEQNIHFTNEEKEVKGMTRIPSIAISTLQVLSGVLPSGPNFLELLKPKKSAKHKN
jgi:hypothetical protein